MTNEAIATEAAATSKKSKKAQSIIDRVIKVMKMIEPAGSNADRYKAFFDAMSEKEFDRWMTEVRDGKRKLTVMAPNVKTPLFVPNMLKAADEVGAKLFEKVSIWDSVGERYYTTPKEYLVLRLPVRRLKQFLTEKRSIPESDRKIDLHTGQVIKPDKGASVSMMEMQTYMSKGLLRTLTEVTNIRGGNVAAYAEMRGDLEEFGEASLEDLDPTTRIRSSEVASAYFDAMMISNTL